MGIKIIITGYRDFNDQKLFDEIMNNVIKNDVIDEISCGDCRGTDFLARNFCKIKKIKNNVYKADWKTFGLSAGPIRNQKMIDDCLNYDLLISFISPKSKGTISCVNYAEKKKMKVVKIQV